MATITTTVIYENGVLRPLEKLDLPERQKAQVTIEPIPSEEETSPFTFPDEDVPPQNLYELLKETPPEYIAEGYSDSGLMTREEFEAGLRAFEEAYGMSSAEFYDKWQREEIPYSGEMYLWAISYRDYLENRIMFKDEWPLEEIVGRPDDDLQ
jgi:predicted DNA-binding antitoxin AbrB/MazE fold protein